MSYALPKMASSNDDVFDQMGLSDRIFNSDIPSRFQANINTHKLITRTKNVELMKIVIRMYTMGYTDDQIITMCHLRGFPIENYLDDNIKDITPTDVTTSLPIENVPDTSSDHDVDIPTEHKVTIINSAGIIRTLQIFCELKTSTLPADGCLKCKHLASINYESMQVVCKYDPTSE